jgi:hypothetical protein
MCNRDLHTCWLGLALVPATQGIHSKGDLSSELLQPLSKQPTKLLHKSLLQLTSLQYCGLCVVVALFCLIEQWTSVEAWSKYVAIINAAC